MSQEKVESSVGTFSLLTKCAWYNWESIWMKVRDCQPHVTKRLMINHFNSLTVVRSSMVCGTWFGFRTWVVCGCRGLGSVGTAVRGWGGWGQGQPAEAGKKRDLTSLILWCPYPRKLVFPFFRIACSFWNCHWI